MKTITLFFSKILVLFILILPINATCQSSFETLTENSHSTLLVYKVSIDQKYINWVNDSEKLSSEEKVNKIADHKAKVEEYNNNLEEAVEGWKGNHTVIISDTTKSEYTNLVSSLKEAKENGDGKEKFYIVTYSSEPLIHETTSFKDPIFGLSHRPSFILLENDIKTGAIKLLSKNLVCQGVLSAGLITIYINSLVAQKVDTDNGITWKSKNIFNDRMRELKTKTLLIPEEFINKNLTIEDIKEVYLFDFKVVKKDELSLLIQNNESGKEYVIYQIIPQTLSTRTGQIVPEVEMSQSSVSYKSALFDAKSGRRMDIQKIEVSLAGTSGTNDLTKKELKEIVSQIN